MVFFSVVILFSLSLYVGDKVMNLARLTRSRVNDGYTLPEEVYNVCVVRL